MTELESLFGRGREWFRRRERLLAAAYLAGVLLLLGGLAAAPVRERVLYRFDLALRLLDARWTWRLERGERLVAEGRYEEAAAYLAALDREFPATNVRHARDTERVRLLHALARSYEGLGRKNAALATYHRAVDFDPRNYASYAVLGEAYTRLEVGWAMPAEARDAYLQVLRIHPNHLPSVRGVMDYYVDRGEWRPAVATFEAYLNAMLFRRVRLVAGDTAAEAHLPVDGRTREVEFRLRLPPSWGGEVVLDAGGYPVDVEAARARPALVVGAPVERRERELEPAAARPLDTGSAPAWRVPPTAGGTDLVRIRLRLRKPVDTGLWEMARKSYRNLLAYGAMEAAADRVAVLPTEAADALVHFREN